MSEKSLRGIEHVHAEIIMLSSAPCCWLFSRMGCTSIDSDFINVKNEDYDFKAYVTFVSTAPIPQPPMPGRAKSNTTKAQAVCEEYAKWET